jgi:hypothetical protein
MKANSDAEQIVPVDFEMNGVSLARTAWMERTLTGGMRPARTSKAMGRMGAEERLFLGLL